MSSVPAIAFASDASVVRPTSWWRGCAPKGSAATTTSTRSTSGCTTGELSRAELQTWTLNRYYYQTRIPIKDALIVSKSRGSGVPAGLDPADSRSRRRRARRRAASRSGCGWPRRSGSTATRWRAAGACLPGVRFACDAYVALCRESPLVVAVASSLTEMFAPDLMSKRIAGLGAALPLGRRRGARLLPRARAARAPRRRRGARVRGRQRHLARAAGGLRGGAGAQDGDPLAPGRLRRGGERAEPG